MLKVVKTLPADEQVVEMIEFNGKIFVASTKRVFMMLADEGEEKLKELSFYLSEDL